MTKMCSNCGECKPLEEFHRRSASKDGRAAHCKSCRSAYMSAYNSAHREEIAAHGRAYRAAHRDWLAAQRHARYEADRQHVLARQSRYRDGSRRRFLQAIKLAAGCIDCGYDGDPAKLHFDHRPETEKAFNVSACGRSWPRLVVEVTKCDVRCDSCHRKRHEAEKRTALA